MLTTLAIHIARIWCLGVAGSTAHGAGAAEAADVGTVSRAETAARAARQARTRMRNATFIDDERFRLLNREGWQVSTCSADDVTEFRRPALGVDHPAGEALAQHAQG